MEDYVINLTVMGVLWWTTAFVLIRKAFPEQCNRIVSMIHAVVAVTLASLSVQNWSCPICPLASTSSEQMQTLAVSFSYLIYDLICCLFDKRVDLYNIIHHLVAIVGIGAGLAYQKCGSEMVASLWIAEISTPFLHMREILKEIGCRHSDLNLAADISFAVIFSLARMVGGPYLTYVMGLGLQLVSAFWFYRIARMVRYKMLKRTSPRKVA